MAETVRARGKALADPARRRAAYTWNHGLAGVPAPGARVARPGQCPNGNERCGRLPRMGRGDGMVLVKGPSGSLPLAYCEGWCERYGQALVDVRSLRPSAGRRAAS